MDKPTTKRKVSSTSLHRRIRQRRELSEDLQDTTFPAAIELNSRSPENVSDNASSETESSSESENDNLEASNISFGALAKAQSSLIRSDGRKRPSATAAEEDSWENNEARERKSGRKDHRDFNRASKHAPMELSSKKAVSRKREVVPIAKREYRDPRFEPVSEPLNQSKLKAAYSFLDDYRDNEMKELKSAIKTTKDEEQKDTLKRALMSMESRKAMELRKLKEQEILDQHRKEEKDLVRQGKKPFYLKRAEQKKRVLLDQFRELKGKQLDHVIQRRRKKLEGKEKKKLPFTRRLVE